MHSFAALILLILFSASQVNQKDSTKTKPVPASLKKLLEQVVKQIVKQPAKSKEFEIEIDGLLVDDTKTKAGKDFYDLFYSNWEAPKDAKNFTITVSEKPFRLTSTLIVVSINDNPVYQAILQPRQDIIEGLSDEAIATTLSYLENYEEIMKQLNGDDMAGSGIY
jgi:curli production assembly/transport component CsgE